MTYNLKLCTGATAALLVGVSTLAFAQDAAPQPQGNLTAEEATHAARLMGANPDVTGTALFAINAADRSFRWSIETAGMETTAAARVSCPASGLAGAGGALAPAATPDAAGAAAPPPGGAGAAPGGAGVPAPDAAAPAAGATPAPGATPDATPTREPATGATPAPGAATTPAPAGTPAEGAGAATPEDAVAGALTGRIQPITEANADTAGGPAPSEAMLALDLTTDGTIDAEGRLQGAYADVAVDFLAAMETGSCYLTVGAVGGIAGGRTAQEGQIIVEQTAPTVQVAQGEVRVFVTQPPATVDVTQDPPTIVVRQPAPIIRIEIPDPIVTVDMPEPEITVTLPDPRVALDVPQPQIRIEQAQPQVVVTQPEPQVRVEMEPGREAAPAAEVAAEAAAPQVEFEAAQQPVVNINRAEPQVQVERGEPVIEFTAPQQPQVQVNEAGPGQVIVQRPEDTGAGAAAAPTGPLLMLGAFTPEQIGAGTETQVTVAELRGMPLMTAQGESLGAVDLMVRTEDRVYIVVQDGTALGAPGRAVAVPAVAVSIVNNAIVVPPLSEGQLGQATEWPMDQLVTMRDVDTVVMQTR